MAKYAVGDPQVALERLDQRPIAVKLEKVVLGLIAMLDDFDAVIPEVGGKLQPLHAVYRRSCARTFERLAVAGEKRLTTAASAINARIVDEASIRKLDPQLNSFFNVNTPEDYGQALKLAGFA